jgi:hypothetical protein
MVDCAEYDTGVCNLKLDLKTSCRDCRWNLM